MQVQANIIIWNMKGKYLNKNGEFPTILINKDCEIEEVVKNFIEEDIQLYIDSVDIKYVNSNVVDNILNINFTLLTSTDINYKDYTWDYLHDSKNQKILYESAISI